MSHLLLVSCFAQLLEAFESVLHRTQNGGVSHLQPGGEMGVNGREVSEHHCELQGEFPGNSNAEYHKYNPSRHLIGASVLEHGKKQLCTQWGNATYFIIVSAWVTVSSTAWQFHSRAALTVDTLVFDNCPDAAAGFFQWELLEPLSSKSPFSLCLHHLQELLVASSHTLSSVIMATSARATA